MESGIISTTMPTEGTRKPPKKNVGSGTKGPKSSTHRVTKRTSQNTSRSPTHDHGPLSPQSGSLDSRHKRVWKACERCRMKKTKCDGEFPCKRCKDDGLVCTAGTRKKTEYKQLPRGYAEVLEHTQLALVATIHKLYGMVRNGQEWNLGEPELSDRGQPVIHDIATKLGCIRPNADADLPPHSVFPEDEPGMSKLAAELEVQQKERERERDPDMHAVEIKSETDSTCNPHEAASSASELDHSDFERDYRKAFLNSQDIQTMSPQSLNQPYHDLETNNNNNDQSTPLFHAQPQSQSQSPSAPAPDQYPVWVHQQQMRPSMGIHPQFMAAMDADMADIMLSQGLIESEFGTIKPHILSCPNSEAMLGLGDPMMYSGY